MDSNEPEYIDLERVSIPPEVLRMVSASMAQVYRIIPIRFEDNMLTVAMADPSNVNTLDDLRFMLNCEVNCAIADEQQINAAIERYYGAENPVIKDEPPDSENETANSPIPVRFLNLLILTAIRDRADAVVLFCDHSKFTAHVNIAGKLSEIPAMDVPVGMAVCARAKIMAGIDIFCRTVQQGSLELEVGGQPVELQVSTRIKGDGEEITLRIRYK